MILCATQEILLTFPERHSFTYDFGIKIIPSATPTSETTICCHGYGHNNTIVDVVNSYQAFSGHLIGFNFPDYNITFRDDHNKCSYGTLDEILPLLYIIRHCVCELKFPRVNLYGFSAGGGAIINALAILHQGSYIEHLQRIGISANDIKEMISALERGYVILDCLLKSMQEILAFREKTDRLEILRNQYTKNSMNPIDNLRLLSGLCMNVILHFQNPDEILSNRDHMIFIERLQKANKGTTKVLIGSDGGHNTYHETLWHYYKKI
jgi:hypothetical protein